MVNLSLKNTIFDLRLTHDKTLDNPIKYYQHVSFDRTLDKNAIAYLVININEFKFFIKNYFGSTPFRIDSYGYFSKPSNLARIPYEEVYMLYQSIEKNSKKPGMFINFPN